MTIDPTTNGLEVASAINGPVVTLTYSQDAPADETCYNFDFAGTTAVGGDVIESGADFCVCYNEADVDGSGSVNVGDRTSLNADISKRADEAVYVASDVDRTGTVNAGDRTLLLGGQNWYHSPTPCP